MAVESNSLGHYAENLACEYLQAQGLVFLEKNFRLPCGEIDLIMKQGEEIIFVEVRMRTDPEHGDPLESIDRRKRAKILKTATLYLLQKKLYNKVFCRIDVIGIEAPQKIIWIKNAFGVDFV